MSTPTPAIPDGYYGIVQLNSENNNQLNIYFRFDRKRIAILRTIKGCRFNKILKCWQINVLLIEELKKHRLFSDTQIFYDFSHQSIKSVLLENDYERKKLLDEILRNPFSVSEDLITKAKPDIFFKCDAQQRLYAFLNDQSLGEYLEKFSFLISHSIGAYFIGTEKLSELLIELRNDKISFAVESTTANILKGTAELRKKLIFGNESNITKQQFKEALLFPYVSIDSKNKQNFKLQGYLREHVKLFFPQFATHPQRKKLAESFSIEILYKILFIAKLNNINIWLDATTNNKLELNQDKITNEVNNKDQVIYNENYLVKANFKALWFAKNENCAGLIILESYYNEHKDKFLLLEHFKIIKNFLQPNYLFFYSNNEIDIITAYNGISEHFIVKKNQNFQDLLISLERGKLKNTKALKYKTLTDIQLNLNNKELQSKLFPHQRVGVSWLLENDASFLGDDMGLGKTLTTLAAFEELKIKGEVDFLLLISPSSLVKNWLREQVNWIPKFKFAACPENKKDRVNLFHQLITDSEKIFDGLLINYESARIPESVDDLMKICRTRKVFLCFDESQRLKNAKSVGFKSMAKIAPLAVRKVLLSGTPTPKDICDIWSQYYLLDGGERFGKSYYEWLKKIANLGNKWSEFAVRSFKPEEVKKVIEKAQELLLRRKKEQVINLPEKIYSIRDVSLKADQLKLYDELRKDLLIKITKISGDDYYKQINSIFEQYLRAVQIACNPRLVDPLWKGTPAKFEELDLIVEELVHEQGRKIIIWTNFIINVDELVERYKKYGTLKFTGELKAEERSNTIQNFQSTASGTAKILIAIPAAGGVGITLTAAQTAIYLDKTWNAEHWMQSVDRVHRIGQTGVVNIISLHSCKIDEAIYYSLWRKQNNQARILGDKFFIENSDADENKTSINYNTNGIELPKNANNSSVDLVDFSKKISDFPSRQELLESLRE